MKVLFPSSMENPKLVDENCQLEFEKVKTNSELEPILFDYSKWFLSKRIKLNQKVSNDKIIYRGWIFKPDEYKKFYDLLSAKELKLITKPNQYKLMHEFPLIYPQLKEDTPPIETFNFNQKIDIKKILLKFPRFLVKDYVKSVKYTAFPKYFDKDISQAEFNNWMKVFYKYRSNLLTGGICIKKYVNLKKYKGSTNEGRVFYFKNKALAIIKNSDQEISSPPPPQELITKYSRLDSPFYTIDYGKLEDNSWTIIETGDGGVSGLPDNTDIGLFYREIGK